MHGQIAQGEKARQPQISSKNKEMRSSVYKPLYLF
jgi:hypothetical protein